MDRLYQLVLRNAGMPVIIGLSVLAAASTPAMADTTTLVCASDERPTDPPYKITLDQAHGAVTVITIAQQTGPASSTTYPAIYDEQSIKFVWGGEGNKWDETIDRLSGVLTIVAQSNPSAVVHNHCHVGTKQF